MSSHKEFSAQAPGATGVDPKHPARGLVEIVDADAGVVRESAPDGSQRRKVAICGFAASSRDFAPFEDPSYSIWILNQLYRHVPRADREFEIHCNWNDDAANVPGTDHRGWLEGCGIPVYMVDRVESIPTSVAYPVDRVMRNVVGVDYFTSTVAYMIALAIDEFDEQVAAEVAELGRRARADESTKVRKKRGVVLPDAREILLNPEAFLAWRRGRYAEREIAIFGIDLIVGTEYDFQKACVEYILGLAEARNIKLRLPPACALLKQRWRYGYQVEAPSFPISMTEIARRGAALVEQRNELIAKMQFTDGALANNAYWYQVADLRVKNGKVKLNEAASSE